MNWGDIIVISVLLLIIAAVIWGMIRDKKKGRSCGCGSCNGCAMAGSCHANKQ